MKKADVKNFNNSHHRLLLFFIGPIVIHFKVFGLLNGIVKKYASADFPMP